MTHKFFSPYLFVLIALLLLKAVGMIYFILYGNVGLGPDEAQYWTWSQQLDWGYYSKPPGVAWQIWLGTQLFGNTELGVRFVSVVFGFLLSLSIYGVAISSRLKARTAFWAAFAFSLTPLGILSSFFAITDVGAVLFWTLGCWIIVDALAKNRSPNYYGLGIIILLGALFKWPIYLLWLLVLLFMPFQRSLISGHFIFGFLISLVGLAPSVIWNYTHDWATFRHVSATVLGRKDIADELPKSNVLEFLGSQIGLFSPILFVLFLVACFYIVRVCLRDFRQKRNGTCGAGVLFCGITSLIILVAFTVMAFFQKVQGNWSVFAYPTAVVFLSWYALEVTKKGWIWLQTGILLSMVLSLLMGMLPTIQAKGWWNEYPIPYKMNPFKHNLGWDQLTDTLVKSGYDSKDDFLFGDKYQSSSILSFYGPEQKRAYFLNLNGIRNNQFSYWPSMADEQIGKNGFFVMIENSPRLEGGLSFDVEIYRQKLQKYFKEVEFLGVSPLFESYGVMTKGALIFKGIGYNGVEPVRPDLY